MTPRGAAARGGGRGGGGGGRGGRGGVLSAPPRPRLLLPSPLARYFDHRRHRRRGRRGFCYLLPVRRWDIREGRGSRTALLRYLVALVVNFLGAFLRRLGAVGVRGVGARGGCRWFDGDRDDLRGRVLRHLRLQASELREASSRGAWHGLRRVRRPPRPFVDIFAFTATLREGFQVAAEARVLIIVIIITSDLASPRCHHHRLRSRSSCFRRLWSSSSSRGPLIQLRKCNKDAESSVRRATRDIIPNDGAELRYVGVQKRATFFERRR